MMRQGGKQGSRKDVKRILKHAISPYSSYCEGFGNNDSQGCYIATPIIAAGEAKVKGSFDRSLVLEQIQAFDTAEAEGAYVGQINLIPVSSFCGLNGLIWGHDVAVCPTKRVNSIGSANIAVQEPVYDIEDLLPASKRLFGTAREKRFPIIPGSMVPSAYKTISELGPVTLYGGLAIGIPKNDHLSAALFMEYVGSVRDSNENHTVDEELASITSKLLASTIEVGKNHDISFEMVYVGTRALQVASERIGCILVAVPYITLARNAVTPNLLDHGDEMEIKQWESEVSHLFLDRDYTGESKRIDAESDS